MRGELPFVAQSLLSEGKFVVVSPVIAQRAVALVVSLTHLNNKIFKIFHFSYFMLKYFGIFPHLADVDRVVAAHGVKSSTGVEISREIFSVLTEVHLSAAIEH